MFHQGSAQADMAAFGSRIWGAHLVDVVIADLSKTVLSVIAPCNCK
jgi:hypothetical protein